MPDVYKNVVKSYDNLNLYYETHDLDGTKSVIFFVHGAGGDIDAWHFVRSQFLDKGFAAISLDLRGHGHSSHPRTSASFEFKNFVTDIVAVLDKEKIEKVIMIGHSFGAMVASFFAINHPDRLIKLVLISNSFCPPNYLNSARKKSLANKVINFAAIISPPPILKGHSNYPKGKFHKDIEWLGLFRTILRNSWSSYLLTSKQVINLDILNKLSKIITPTLLIAGTKDSIVPMAVTEEIHRQIPNSKLEVIEGGNHVVILNNIDQTVKIISEFIC